VWTIHKNEFSTLSWASLTAWVSVSPALSQSSLTLSSHLFCGRRKDVAEYMGNDSLAFFLRVRSTSSFFQLSFAAHFPFHPAYLWFNCYVSVFFLTLQRFVWDIPSQTLVVLAWRFLSASTFHCCRAADWGQVSRTLWPLYWVQCPWNSIIYSVPASHHLMQKQIWNGLQQHLRDMIETSGAQRAVDVTILNCNNIDIFKSRLKIVFHVSFP